MLELPTINNFFSRTHRISIRLHMQDHNIPLSLFIISVYILTVLVLWNIFSKGHITVTSCLFLRYDPSTLPLKVWKVGKVSFSAIRPKHPPPKSLKGRKSTNALLWIRDFLPFYNFQNGEFQRSVRSWFWKVFFVSISYVPFLLNYCKAKLVVNVS